MNTCPACESANVRISEVPYSTCPATGYLDGGSVGECLDCGTRGDAEEFIEAEEPEAAQEAA